MYANSINEFNQNTTETSKCNYIQCILELTLYYYFNENFTSLFQENTIRYYNHAVQNQMQVKYTEEINVLKNEPQIEPIETLKSPESLLDSPNTDLRMSEDIEKEHLKLQTFTECLDSGKALSEDQLYEVFRIAVNYNIDINHIMEKINEVQKSENINILYKIFASVQPNNSMVKSFLNSIIKPRVSLLL